MLFKGLIPLIFGLKNGNFKQILLSNWVSLRVRRDHLFRDRYETETRLGQNFETETETENKLVQNFETEIETENKLVQNFETETRPRIL